jgi:hypothetical protein
MKQQKNSFCFSAARGDRSMRLGNGLLRPMGRSAERRLGKLRNSSKPAEAVFGAPAELSMNRRSVAQTGSLLYRRLVVGRAAPLRGAKEFPNPWPQARPADCQSATQQTASLRYTSSRRRAISKLWRPLSGARAFAFCVALLPAWLAAGLAQAFTVPQLSGSPVASAGADGTVLAWRTGIELDVAGFNLYRLDGHASKTRLNGTLLLAGVADGVGASYRYRDTAFGRKYQLGIVDGHGVESLVSCVPVASLPEWAQTLPEMATGEVYQRTAPAVGSSGIRGALAIAAPASASGPSPKGSPVEHERLRVTVAESGMYRLTPAQLSLLGMTKAEVSDRLATRQFRVTTGSQRVAWMTDTNDSALLFYHPGGKTLYSAQTVYWVERGRGLVPPPLAGPGPATAAPSTQSFSDTVRFEKDVIGAVFAYNDPTVDFWVWTGFNGGTKVTVFPIALPAMAEPNGQVSLVARVVGATFLTHQAQFYVSNTLVGAASWYGKSPLSVTCNIPAVLVAGGTNSLAVTNAAANTSICYFDYADATYRRSYTALAECLRCGGETNAVVTVRGFTNSGVRLADVSDPRLVREVQQVAVQPDGGGFALSFAPASATNGYYAFSPGAIQAPLTVDSWDAPGLKSATNAADYLVITSSALTNALQPLLAWRTQQGRVCRMIQVQAIADEFGDGIASPQAIRAFLAHALGQWRIAPRAVLLGGKGSYDYRNDTGTAVNHVPVQLVPTSTYLFSSDNALADVVGNDGVPEVAIGRLPAITAAEMSAMVAKIIAYEQDRGGAWTGRAILTAGVPDSGGNFTGSSETAAAFLPLSLTPQRIYLTQYSVSTARTLLINAINSQAVLWNYFGHGGLNILDSGGLLGISDVSRMTNGWRGPVLLGVTCFIARHEVPNFVTLAETLVKQPGGGLPAAWAPTGLSYDDAATIMCSAILQARYQQGVQPLGEAIRAGLASSAAAGVSIDLIQMFTLLGDPGMVMK